MKTTDILDSIKSLSDKLTSIEKQLARAEEDAHHIFTKLRGLDLLVNEIHNRVRLLEAEAEETDA